MIAEISLVVGALKGINDAINTVKESGSHISDLSGIFTSVTETQVAVDNIEAAVEEDGGVLTQKQALEIAWAKKELADIQKELKKQTPRDVWRTMLSVQHKSVMDNKQRLEKDRLNKLRKQSKNEDILKNVIGYALLLVVLYAAYFFYGK